MRLILAAPPATAMTPRAAPRASATEGPSNVSSASRRRGSDAGTILGEFADGDEAAVAAAVHALPAGSRDKVVRLQVAGGRTRLVDGLPLSPPYLPLANDSRGLSSTNSAMQLNRVCCATVSCVPAVTAPP